MSDGITRLFARHNYQAPTHRCLKCGASKNAPAFGARHIDCPNCARYADLRGTMEFIRGAVSGGAVRTSGVVPHGKRNT